MDSSLPGAPATTSILAHRDCATEIQLLSMLNGINYVLLQRDWNAPRHGDLDMVVDAMDWPRLIEAIVVFCSSNDICIAKAYEIERAVVCIVLITRQGYVQVDVAVTPHRREIFGVPLLEALESREFTAGAYVLTPKLAEIYREKKRRYKASGFRRFVDRILNGPIIVRRIIEATLIRRGAIIYTPYVRETSLLRSYCITTWVTRYLQTSLLKRYQQTETSFRD